MKKNLKKQLKKMFENGEGKFYPKFVINNDWRQEDYIMCCFNICGMEVIHAIIYEGYFIRDANYLIPLEVKANDNATVSLNNLIDNCKDINYGIKLCNKNIGFNGKFYTFPYFTTFLLKRYLREKQK